MSALTRAVCAPATHVLVYDGGCTFCASAARWAASRSRVPLVAVTIGDLPRDEWLASLSDADVLRQAHLITPSGVEYHGGAATTAALRLTRFAVVGWTLDLPGLRVLRDAGYAIAVRSRGFLSRVIEWRST